jgi:hypothetical protein
MNRKLITTVVVAAINVYVATLAQAACPTDGSTPFTSGPLNPVNGFTETVTDSNGVALQLCTDPTYCFLSPVVPGNAFSAQIGSGIEMFFWSAGAKLSNAAGMRMVLTMATEAAFLSAVPIDGQQIEFARLRVTLNVPDAGVYTLTHPYGVETMVVDVAAKGRDVFNTYDRSFAPNTTVQGRVGPWLKWDPAVAPAAPTIVRPDGTIQQFLGDGSPAGPTHSIVGSPCGTNFVTLSAVPLTAGDPPINLDGAGHNFITTNQFNVSGMVFDGKFQTPLSSDRLTYSRAVGAIGQIDAFALTSPTALVTVADAPNIPLGTSRIPVPVALTNDGLGLASTSDVLTFGPNTVDMPPMLSLSATTPGPTPVSDPTTLLRPLVDFVKISSADYDPTTQLLTVTAASGDLRVPPTLTVAEYNTPVGTPISTIAPTGTVKVVSSAGGSDVAKVRVVTASVPIAPSGLAASASTSQSVALTWTDNSTNESGFDIYRNGVKVGSVAANVTTYTDTGLLAATAYSYQVFAVNTLGQTGSNVVSATTLALPVTPGAVTAVLGTQRAINVGWTDNSADETGFQILRGSASTGPFAQIATVAAAAGTGARTFVDTVGPPAAGTTYFYQVVAVRGTDSSVAATSATGLATPATPTSALVAAPLAVSGTQVNVSWTDRATNETGYQVYRSTTTTGGFAAVSAVLPAGTITFSDTTVVAGTQYFYRVDVSNWAATVPSALSTGVTPPAAVVTLAAPGNLAVSSATANPPVLGWTDTSTGETGYRVQRRTVTLANNGTRSNGTFATVTTTAANATAFTDTTQTANAIVEYSVAPVNGATVGPAAAVLAVPGGITGVAAAPTFTRGGNTVTIAWSQAGTTTANRAGIGGYSVQRCTVTAADTCAAASAGWASVATTTGRTTVTATNTVAVSAPTKTYRYRVVSTSGPNAVTSVTGTPSPASATLVR